VPPLNLLNALKGGAFSQDLTGESMLCLQNVTHGNSKERDRERERDMDVIDSDR